MNFENKDIDYFKMAIELSIDKIEVYIRQAESDLKECEQAHLKIEKHKKSIKQLNLAKYKLNTFLKENGEE